MHKYTRAEKNQMEIMRRWKAVIEDIEIKNETGELIQPFVQFIIGGDHYVSNTAFCFGLM